eukprot:CAMPEP_0115556238 /NCGR_PEP_ID=MMETSP0271-20121206/98254_1 /TAXON_ID=71861 /ORGANISM="Scrippsiella trochoidea, Strain CCMP3099" /LENGTH=89 /DNA_ID=CAMNT_0002990085 /DNA_START=77 /DNA_END=344 /DNA_ORIENTATION=+
MSGEVQYGSHEQPQTEVSTVFTTANQVNLTPPSYQLDGHGSPAAIVVQSRVAWCRGQHVQCGLALGIGELNVCQTLKECSLHGGEAACS